MKAQSAAISSPVQRLFVIVAGTVYLFQCAYWARLLRITYPGGQHIGGLISIAIWMSIILPLVLFAIAYIVGDKKEQRHARLFRAALLAFVALLVQLPIVALMSIFFHSTISYHGIAFTTLGIAGPLVALAVAYGGMLFYARKSVGWVALAGAGAALVSNVVMNVPPYADQFGKPGLHHITDVLFSPLLTEPIVLPVLFFAIAYFTVAKQQQRFDRAVVAAIYGLLGVMLAATVDVVYGLSQHVVFTAIYFNTTMVIFFVSLVVYVMILAWQSIRSART